MARDEWPELITGRRPLVEVRYIPGDGVLVARGGRWLLLGPAGVIAPEVLDQLWDDLGRPSASSRALTTVHQHLDGPPLAWLDAATSDTYSESGGIVERDGDGYRLSVGPPSAASEMRLLEGVVAASSVQVTIVVAPPTVGPGGPSGVLIDGIPPEILAPRPAPPAAYDETSDALTDSQPDSQPDFDHDHHTVRRDPVPLGVGGSPPGHLEQSTSDTVLAVRCRQGHLTDPLGTGCRVCGEAVPDQEPQRVLRPPLGILQLPDGPPLPLDRPVVFGRQPSPSGPGDWPHLVTLPQDSTYLSRRHLRIDLDGWHVLAEDLASRGGTTVSAPGRDPERIRAYEPFLLENGTTLDLAGAYQLTYLTTIPAGNEDSP